jgi:lysophospholipase L1-like esterase
MIYVIGDSHTAIFKQDAEFKVVDIGGATAHNLISEKSTTNSHQKIQEVINSINKTSDFVMLTSGEIDCRFHIYYQAKKRNVPTSYIVNETVRAYGEALFWLLSSGVDPIVLGITPPGTYNSYELDMPGKPYASPGMLARIYADFNTKMKEYCEEHAFIYLDIYSKTVDENGFLKKEYAADAVHLNEKSLPLIKELLKEELVKQHE